MRKALEKCVSATIAIVLILVLTTGVFGGTLEEEPTRVQDVDDSSDELDDDEVGGVGGVGELLWQHEIHEGPVFGVQESDGVVYSSSGGDGPGEPGNTVLAYDYESDEVVWQHGEHDYDIWALYESEGVVYTSDMFLGDGFYYRGIATDAETGDILWERESGGQEGEWPFIFGVFDIHVNESDEVLYTAAMCHYDSVGAHDPETGELKWTHNLHSGTHVFSVHESGGILYSACEDAEVIAYDVEEKEKVWEHEHHDDAVRSVTEYDGMIYSSGYDDSVIAVDAETGEKIWEHEHHDQSEPIQWAVGYVHASNGVVYSGSFDTNLTAADAKTGDHLWTHQYHEDGSVNHIHESDGVVYTASGDKTVIAYDTEPHDLTIDSTEGGEVVEPGEDTFGYGNGTVVDLEAEAHEDYEFVEWQGDIDEIEDPESAATTIEMWDDYSITAEFEAEVEEYGLTIDSTEGGEVVDPGEGTFEYDHEEMIDLEAEAHEGYEFVEWTGETVMIEDPESAATTIEMWDDYSITAEFAGDTHELDVDSTDGGEVVDPGEGTFEYDHGETVYLEASADENYHFVEWTGDVEEIDDTGAAETTIEMLDDYSITAEFAVPLPELELDSTEGGEVVDPGEGIFEYESRTTVYIESEAHEGYEFVEWTGETVMIEDPESAATTIEMWDDYSITAEFEEIVSELSVNLEGEGNVTVEYDEKEYEIDDEWSKDIIEGTEIILTANPEENWKFEDWTGDYEGDEREITITLDEDMEITANFLEEEDDDDDEWWEVPGFTYLTLVLGAIIAVAIYRKKENQR